LEFSKCANNFFVVAYNGSLILYSATHLIQPNSDGGEDLGTTNSAKRFGSLHLKNDRWIAGVQTVDTKGRVTSAGMPRDIAGFVLEVQGAGFYPIYVNPNGRHAPPIITPTCTLQAAKTPGMRGHLDLLACGCRR